MRGSFLCGCRTSSTLYDPEPSVRLCQRRINDPTLAFSDIPTWGLMSGNPWVWRDGLENQTAKGFIPRTKSTLGSVLPWLLLASWRSGLRTGLPEGRTMGCGPCRASATRVVFLAPRATIIGVWGLLHGPRCGNRRRDGVIDRPWTPVSTDSTGRPVTKSLRLSPAFMTSIARRVPSPRTGSSSRGDVPAELDQGPGQQTPDDPDRDLERLRRRDRGGADSRGRLSPPGIDPGCQAGPSWQRFYIPGSRFARPLADSPTPQAVRHGPPCTVGARPGRRPDRLGRCRLLLADHLPPGRGFPSSLKEI